MGGLALSLRRKVQLLGNVHANVELLGGVAGVWFASNPRLPVGVRSRLGVAGGGSSGWSLPSFFLGVFLVLFFSRFLRCSSLPLRVCWSLLLSPFGWVLSCFVPVVLAVAFTVLFVWSLVVAVGRLVLRFAFVRFPRPSSVPPAAWAVARACRSAGVVPRGWCCCPASALSSVRSRCFVWAVLPAVVSRRTGVVSFFWVWVGLSPSHT